MKRLAFASVACLALGWIACSPAVEEADESAGAVVGGDLDDTNPAIGFLGYAGSPNVPFCTGTLIAPDVVLTAAHCVDAYESARARKAPVDEYIFGVGRVDRSKAYPIASVKRHPAWVKALTNFECSTSCVFQHDVAYVLLAKPVEKITPLTVQRTAHVGSCEYVATGYGISLDGYGAKAPKLADGDLGQRRSVGLCVQTKLVDGMIQIKSDEGAICNGDSGGPLRRRGGTDLVGTVSYRLAREACTAGATAYYTPVLTNLPFIDEALAQSKYRSTEPKPDGGTTDAGTTDASTDSGIAIDAGPADAGAVDPDPTADAGDAGAPIETDAGTGTTGEETGETSELPPSESPGSTREDGTDGEDDEVATKKSKAGASESSGCAASSNGKAPTSDLAGAFLGLALLLGLRRAHARRR